MINGHGDDLYRYEGIKANFSSNVYAEADNARLIQHLQGYLSTASASYPEPEAYSLQTLLALHHGVPKEAVLVTNGATEAIYLIAHLFAGQEVSISEPTFSEYLSASLLYGANIIDYAPIRWLCSPNNPTGRVQSEDWPDVETLIVDRSYEYFCRKPLPPLQLDDKHIYIHSLTKRYRIPGLRLGYIISSPSLVDRLRQLRQPWSVNALAIEAGRWVVQNAFPETIDRPFLWSETDRLASELRLIEGIELEDSDTHFMLLSTPLPASLLKERLAQEYKLLIRDASNFLGLSSQHIRIATQSPQSNALLLSALRTLIPSNSR